MQLDLPIVDALKSYLRQEILPFHMPGHIGGRGFDPDFANNILQMDLTELPGLDDLHAPCGIIKRAQELASVAFGSDNTFFLVNGSTAGIHAMIAGTLNPKDKLIIPRNCHRSVAASLALFDITPIYIQNEYDFKSNLVLPISPSQVESALERHPDAKGVLVINPDYYGLCGHIEVIEKLVHSRDKLLLVDEAHGAHFNFHSKLPVSASKAGADVWVQSAHKTLPALTQSGYLHIKGKRVCKDRIFRMLSLIQTSSPSYMIMASLDSARGFMKEYGEVKLSDLIKSLKSITSYIKNRWGEEVVPAYRNSANIAATDPTRLVIDISRTGLTGHSVFELFRDNKIEPEMADFLRVVFICSVTHNEDMFDFLQEKIDLIFKLPKRKQVSLPAFRYSAELPQQIISPKEAMNSIIENVPLKECTGRVCAQAVGAYPPGIPLFYPGELIDEQGIENLLAIKESGGLIFGMDSDLRMSVVKL